jgi:hypothetical protein
LREAIEELQGIETLVSKPQTTRNGDGEEREKKLSRGGAFEGIAQ